MLNELLFGGGALHSCFVIALVGFLGVYLGKVRIGGIAFGSVFVFFVGILAGHFGMTLDSTVSDFVQNFGLAIFIFSLGLQVGPSFFPSLRSGGLSLNLLATLLLVLNIGVMLFIYFTTDTSLIKMVGVMCGAVPNSASLGAAQQAIKDIGLGDGAISEMAMACAASYPFGVISSMVIAIILYKIFASRRGGESSIERMQSRTKPTAITLEITNSDINGTTVADIHNSLQIPFIISQIQRGDTTLSPNSMTPILLGDTVLITARVEHLDELKKGLGKQVTHNWLENSNLIQRRIFVSKPEVNGKSIEALQIRRLFNVNITFVNRAGIELVASPDLVLLVGDRLNMVGDATSIDKVEKMLGNAIKKLDEPNLLVMFIGIATGILLGSIPIFIPGISTPIKLGLTGGAVMIGILFGAFGYRFKLITYTPLSANLLLRELGITLYLACLGVDAGKGFIAQMTQGDGFMLLLYGVAISLIPLLIVGVVAIRYMKMDMSLVFGMICGGVSTSQALPYMNDLTGKSIAPVAYSTVYPLNLFLRVLTTQLLIVLLT